MRRLHTSHGCQHSPVHCKLFDLICKNGHCIIQDFSPSGLCQMEHKNIIRLKPGGITFNAGTKLPRPRPCFCNFQTSSFNKLDRKSNEKVQWVYMSSHFLSIEPRCPPLNCRFILYMRAASTTDGIRLVGGPSPFEGRVQLLFSSATWRDVHACREWWREEEATVACRQLGFTNV